MDNSTSYWKEKLVIAASLIIFNFVIVIKLFHFISNSTLLFIEQQTNPIPLLINYILFTIFIPGILFSLCLFIFILIYYVLIRSLWLFDAEENNILGKKANNIYQLSFNILIKALIFFSLFAVVNIILFIILGFKLGYSHTYSSYMDNPNNLTYYFALLITNLLFAEAENILSKRCNLPPFSIIFPIKQKEESRKIGIKTLLSFYIKNILFLLIISLTLIFSIQFIGGISNRLNLQIQSMSENSSFSDPIFKTEITIKGITNTGRQNTIPIYLKRMNKLYQKGEREFIAGNYLSAINLLQKELAATSNFSVSISSDRFYPWISKLLGNKMSDNILFVKNTLEDSLENGGYSEEQEEGLRGENISSLPLAIHENLKINIWRNSLGTYSQIFKKSELLNISQSHITKKIGDCFLLLGNFSSAKEYYNQALEKNSYYIEARNNLGFIYARENNRSFAEAEYRNILDIKPDYSLAKINLGNLYLNSGQVDYALNILQTINLENGLSQKTKKFYYQILASVFSKKKEYSKAEQIYHKVLKIDSFYYPASMGLAEIYWEKKEFTKAKKIYEDILKRQNIASAYIGMAKYYIQQKDKKNAISYFNKAINIGDDYEAGREGFIGIGRIYFDGGNLTEAEEYFNRAIKIDPYYYLPYQELGKIYFRTSKWENAKSNFLKALEMFPQNEEVQKYLEEVYKAINKETQARYEKIVDTEKPHKEKEKLIYAYKNLGWIHLENKNYEGALKNFNQAITINPNYIEALYGMGILFMKTEKYNDARKVFQKIIDLNKSYAMAYIGLGTVNIKLNDPNKAIENFNYVFKLDDINAKSHASMELGWVFYNQKNYSQARDKFFQALTFKENVPEAYYGLGMVYSAQKLYERARMEFRKAINLRPDYRQAREELTKVTNLISEGMKREMQIIHTEAERLNLYKTIESYINKGELEKAKNALSDILTDNPEDLQALKYLGLIYFQKRAYLESKKQWDRILRVNNQDIEARHFINIINEKMESTKINEEEFFIPLLSEGVDLYQKGELLEAKEKLLKAVTLNNKSPVAHKYLAKIYYKFKEYDPALRELERSLELDPNQPDIKNSILKLRDGYTVFKGLD